MTIYNFAIIDEDSRTIIKSLDNVLSVLSGKTLLITGASGFLCSYLVDVILMANDIRINVPCSVIAVDNLKTGILERLVRHEGRSDFTFIQHDINQAFVVDKKVDYVVHGAGIASPVFYRKYPLETIDVNVTGTRMMLEFVREQDCTSLLYLSTSEIYGDPDPANIPTSESYWGNVSSTGPRACYDESKRLAETLCMTYFRLHSTPVKIARPFNIYGPGQRLDDGRIIPDLMRAAIHNQPIILFSDGKPTRAFCYVADAISALLRLLLSKHDGDVFNIGNDTEEISIGELAQVFSQIGGAIPVEFQVSDDKDYLTDNPNRRCPNIEKARTLLDWSPKISLNDGLGRTLAYYRGI